MIIRSVTGPVNGPNGTPLVSGTLKCKLLSPVAEGTTFVSPDLVTADIVNGVVSIDLTAPGRYDFSVVSPLGDTVWHFQATLGDDVAADISLAELFLASGDCQFPSMGFVRTGVGNPENVVIAVPGVLYLNLAGGTGITLWVKELNTDATGWVAK